VAFGFGVSIHYSFKVEQVVVYLPLLSALVAVKNPFICLGGPPKGLCLSLVSFLYLSFLTCLEEGIALSCFRLRCYEGGGWALA